MKTFAYAALIASAMAVRLMEVEEAGADKPVEDAATMDDLADLTLGDLEGEQEGLGECFLEKTGEALAERSMDEDEIMELGAELVAGAEEGATLGDAVEHLREKGREHGVDTDGQDEFLGDVLEKVKKCKQERKEKREGKKDEKKAEMSGDEEETPAELAQEDDVASDEAGPAEGEEKTGHAKDGEKREKREKKRGGDSEAPASGDDEKSEGDDEKSASGDDEWTATEELELAQEDEEDDGEAPTGGDLRELAKEAKETIEGMDSDEREELAEVVKGELEELSVDEEDVERVKEAVKAGAEDALTEAFEALPEDAQEKVREGVEALKAAKEEHDADDDGEGSDDGEGPEERKAGKKGKKE